MSRIGVTVTNGFGGPTRITRDPDDERCLLRIGLTNREIVLQARVIRETGLLDALGDAHHRPAGHRVRGHPHALADRVLTGPECLGHRFADQHDRRRAGAIGLGE
jgi:hypothetical protein